MTSEERLQSGQQGLKVLNNAIEVLETTAAREARTVLEGAAMIMFEKFPKLGVIEFRAFTPYFNDGDPCVFRSEHEYPEFFGLPSGDDPEERGEDLSYEDGIPDTWQTLVEGISSRDIQNLFEDHSEIVISRANGIVRSEYSSHD